MGPRSYRRKFDRHVWTVLLLLVAGGMATVWGATSPDLAALRRREPNPALIYWQAIALLPDLTKAEWQMPLDVSGGRIAPDAKEVQTLLEKVQPSLQRFRRAAFSETVCDWGVTLDDGPYAVMPHLSKMQFMCRLAALQAEHLFVKSKPEEALQWLLAAHRSARHVGEGKMLAMVLEEYILEAHVLRATARHVKRLDANQRIGHRHQLDLLPGLHLVSEALQGEQLVAEWLHRMLLGLENAPNLEEAIAGLLQSARDETETAGGSGAADATARGVGDDRELSRQEIQQLLQQWQVQREVISKGFARLREVCDLPWEKAIPEIKKLVSDPALSFPAAQNTAMLIENHLRKRLETETQQRMLKAALMLGPELQPGLVDGWKDCFFNEPLMVRKEKDVLIMTMRQPVGNREVQLRLAPVNSNP